MQLVAESSRAFEVTETRTAVITGGASGLGRAFTERLARDGLRVVIADIVEPTDKDSLPSGVLSFTCDVADQAQVADLGLFAEEEMGHVDVLVNCAGIFPLVSFEDTTLDIWDRVLAVNLTGPFLTCKRFVPGMAERGFGRVVNVSSRTFWVTSSDYSAYISAKAGVIGLTRALATEYGPYGVTANAIAPGLTRTRAAMVNAPEELFQALASRQAIPRVPVPEDLVGVVSFLASDDSSFLTGQTLMVDGGLVRL
jgi:3-oxoacyl-[acyl-carrier protein] reductase/(S)-1-phenylethanol dehydrogenase